MHTSSLCCILLKHHLFLALHVFLSASDDTDNFSHIEIMIFFGSMVFEGLRNHGLILENEGIGLDHLKDSFIQEISIEYLLCILY